MRRNFLTFFFIAFLSLFLFDASPALAAKARVARISGGGVPRTAGIAYSRAKLSRGTNSIVLTFLNLSKVKSVTYTLSYVAGGIPQGAVGTLTVSGQETDSRDLYFGTCSHGVCTAHNNLKNVTLTVTTRLLSGATHSKRYRIKV